MIPNLPCALPDAPYLPGRTVDLVRLDIEAHASGLWRAIGADPARWTWIPSGPFADTGAFSEWLETRARRDDVILNTVLDKTGPAPVPAGLYFLLHLDPAMGVAEFGLMLGPALSGRTGGTEAFYLRARYLFETLGYRRLEWRCHPDNLASVRAAERFGFTREGVLRQAAWLKGGSWDTALYAMLDHEWPAVAARMAAWLAPENFDAEGRQISRLAGFAQPYFGSSHHGK
jgi:RimJ/RimL family protein N-acetyltransferase